MSGNRNFVAAIAARYGPRLRRFLAVRLRNADDVPDLAQEVFLRLLRVEWYESIRSPEAYLFTIASHVVSCPCASPLLWFYTESKGIPYKKSAMSWAYRARPPKNIWPGQSNTAETCGPRRASKIMRIRYSNGKTHSAVVAEASEWFIEFRAGDVNGEARMRFMEWLRRSPEHIQAYLEVSGAWSELPSCDLEGKFDIAAMIARARNEFDVVPLSPPTPSLPPAPLVAEPRGLRTLRQRPVLAAAALALLASVIAVFAWIDRDMARAYSTGIGEQRTIQLADGSTVELNARSRIEVRLTDRRRDVALIEGQALFLVAKDKQRPFVVRAGEAQVRAVGTEFDIYRKQTGTVVTVVEGRVETYPGSDGTAAIVISAGEQLTVLPHTLTKPTRADTAAATAWVQKRLIFEETPLNEVAEEFNRYNRRPLAIDDAELKSLKISGVYSSIDPASLINFLRNQNAIRVIETEDQVRVVRREAR